MSGGALSDIAANEHRSRHDPGHYFSEFEFRRAIFWQIVFRVRSLLRLPQRRGCRSGTRPARQPRGFISCGCLRAGQFLKPKTPLLRMVSRSAEETLVSPAVG